MEKLNKGEGKVVNKRSNLSKNNPWA